jgi:hypothetical protein
MHPQGQQAQTDPHRKELCLAVDRGSGQVDPQPFPLQLDWAIFLALSGQLRQRRHWAIADR